MKETKKELRLRKEARKGYLTPYTNNTLTAYQTDLRLWFGWCKANKLSPMAVRRIHVEQYAKECLEFGNKPSTVQRKLTVIKGFYRYAEDDDLILKSPCRNLRTPHVPKESASTFLDRSEMTRFLNASSTISPTANVLAHLLAINGLRIGEAVGVRRCDLAWEGGHRTVSFIGKGDKLAIAPLTPPVARALARLLEASEDLGDTEPLMRNRIGGPLSRHSARRVVVSICKVANIDKLITPHSLRHSAITLALDVGVPLRDVQNFARHANPETTSRYDRTKMNLDRSAAYIISSYVSGV